MSFRVLCRKMPCSLRPIISPSGKIAAKIKILAESDNLKVSLEARAAT